MLTQVVSGTQLGPTESIRDQLPNTRHLNSPICKDPLFSWKCVFVGEVAMAVVLGERKMPTSPVFNMVNVSVYACSGWPNYPMSSKIFHCNYHSLQWHLLLKGAPSAAGAQSQSTLSKLPATPAAVSGFEAMGASWAIFSGPSGVNATMVEKLEMFVRPRNKAVNEYYSNLLSHNPLFSLNQPGKQVMGLEWKKKKDY